MVSTAQTCGLSRGGRPLFKIDKTTGKRTKVIDKNSDEMIDEVDDSLLDDMKALSNARLSKKTPNFEITKTLRFIPSAEIQPTCLVPIYYDKAITEKFLDELNKEFYDEFTYMSLGELKSAELIKIRGGHGSPSQEQRVGKVPYIKVSDLRAGFVNINPTNRIPKSIAKKFWKGEASGLQAFDLICPSRTSKNIGDFCVLMPGQEQVVMTKEMIVIRATETAAFDQFYLQWAMSLEIVREQWKRVIFMQTNREDVGNRYLEILIPVPKDIDTARKCSKMFRDYYESVSKSRITLQGELAESPTKHHFFVGI